MADTNDTIEESNVGTDAQQSEVSQSSQEVEQNIDPDNYDLSKLETISDRRARQSNDSENNSGVQSDTTQTDESSDEDYRGEIDLDEFGTILGIDLNTTEDLKKYLEDVSKKNSTQSQSEVLLSLLDDEGNLKKDIVSILAADYDTLPEDEILFQRFMEQNKDNGLYDDTDLARMEFNLNLEERREKAARSKWTEDQWEEYAEMQNLSEPQIERLKKSSEIEQRRLEAETKVARQQAKAKQGEVLSNIKQNRNSQSKSSLTKEQADQIYQTHKESVDRKLSQEYLKKFDLGEGIGQYNMGLDETVKPKISEALYRPFDFLEKEVGISFDENTGAPKIDLDKLMEMAVRSYTYDQLPLRLSKFVSDKSEISDTDRRSMNVVSDPNARRESGNDTFNSRQKLLDNLRQQVRQEQSGR